MSDRKKEKVDELKASPEHPTQAAALDNDICLLVDEDDNFTGTASKRDCHIVDKNGNILLHRAFSVFLFNSHGEMLLQRRSLTKVTYAGYYSNAVCSHPLYIDGKEEDVIAAACRRLNQELGIPLNQVTYAGYYSNAVCSHPLYIDGKEEDVIAAARRRLNQELGIPLNQLDPKLFTFLSRVHYHDTGNGVWGEHEVDHILFYQGDVTVNPNPDEIAEICYVPKDDFDKHIQSLKGPTTPWFNLIRKEKLGEWWDNLHCLQKIAEPKKIYRMVGKII